MARAGEQSAYLLRGPEGSVLLDCGGSTASGLAAPGIGRDEVDAILREFDCGRLVLAHLGSEMRALHDSQGFEMDDDGQVLKL